MDNNYRYFLIHYAPLDSPGDLLSGYEWRKGIVVSDDPTWEPKWPWTAEDRKCSYPLTWVEKNLYDAETGRPVGLTLNYCIDPWCTHSDCGPAFEYLV